MTWQSFMTCSGLFAANALPQGPRQIGFTQYLWERL